MSEAGNAVKKQAAARENVPSPASNRVAELKVSGHLMTLDTGMFCIFHAPGGTVVSNGSGLPGVRISLPPSASTSPDAVRISTFRSDGWLDFSDGAALVRVEHGPAQILVTVYQSIAASADTAPRLQVLRLTQDAVSLPQAQAAIPVPAAPRGTPIPVSADVVAHLQRMGDIPGKFGAWTGTRGSGNWVEGFAIMPPEGVAPQDLEYQAVLGRGWLSPWIEGGKFCGSRGMALPLLGLNVRLKGDAAKTHECMYFASFVDGSSVGPVPSGEACQADSLAALEAFQIVLRRRGTAAAAASGVQRPGRPARTKIEAPATTPAIAPVRTQPAVEKRPVGRPRGTAAATKPAVGRTQAMAPAAKRPVGRPKAIAPAATSAGRPKAPAPTGRSKAPTAKRGPARPAPRRSR